MCAMSCRRTAARCHKRPRNNTKITKLRMNVGGDGEEFRHDPCANGSFTLRCCLRRRDAWLRDC
jgi:hypothetical protein